MHLKLKMFSFNSVQVDKISTAINYIIICHAKCEGHCPPDTEFETRALAVWGLARYLSVTDAPYNIESLRVSGEEIFCFFETLRAEWGSNPRSPTFQAGGFNHWTSPPPPSSKHEALTQCWADFSLSSTTLAQHQFIIGPTSRVCWARPICHTKTNSIVLNR